MAAASDRSGHAAVTISQPRLLQIDEPELEVS
jgi:hypothetical protein